MSEVPAAHPFEAVVEPFTWGRNTYLVLRVPDELAAAARGLGTNRVAGTMDGADVNVGLNRAPDLPEAFVYVGDSMRRRLGVTAGDVVECVLAPADPDVVVLPEDVEEALAEAGALDRWEALRPGRRRALLVPVEGARRPETRARRISDLVATVGG